MTRFQIKSPGGYREHGMLFGAGLAAGLLLFVFWLVFLAHSDEASPDAEPAAASHAEEFSQAGEQGVLSGISGGSAASQARTIRSAADQDDQRVSDAAGVSGSMDATTADQSVQDVPAAISDGEAIANGLLGPAPDPAPESSPDAAPETPVIDPATDH